MAIIRYSQPSAKEGPPPDRRGYDEVLNLRDAGGNLIRSSSSPRGSTYWKRLRRCPREHALYHGGLRRAYPMSEHLTVGLLIHRALEHYYGWMQQWGHEGSGPEQAAWLSIKNFATEPGYEQTWQLVQKMLAGYFERYRDSDAKWKIWAVEETVSYFDGTLEWTGRLDGLIERDGALFILEHKSAKAITGDLLSGYQMDMQMLGYVWLFKHVIDASKLPPLAGIIVNLLTKHATPRYERVEVCPSRYHLAEFEKSQREWIRVRDESFSKLGWPKALGNCTGASRYFTTCDYFDLCHGQPDVPLERLLREELPYGFTRIDIDALDPDEVA